MDKGSVFRRETFCAKKAKQFSCFLHALSDAYDYSRDLSVHPRDFSISYSEAVTFDLNHNDLRWMIGKGWVRTHKTSDSKETVSGSGLGLEKGAQFTISEEGLEIVSELLSAQGRSSFWTISPNTPRLQQTPNWDLDRRELFFNGELIKRFRWPAPNQETVLSVFSEESWPVKIADPLPQKSDVDPKRRLGDTIKCLNRNQLCRRLRFRGDGTGEGVMWEAVV